MTKQSLSLAFIGGGINSAVGATHKIASQMDGRFKVVAGCFSRHEQINMQTGSQWGIDDKRIYSTWQELLNTEENSIDAVVVLTPTPYHTDIVIAAIQKGIPVICEKALTTSVAEAIKIKQAVEMHQGFLAVTYNYTGYPMLRELRHMIQNSKLGKLEQIQIEMPQEGFARLDKHGNPQTPQEWRLHDGDLPTISLDLGVHLHHIIDFLTNEKPLELVAVHNSFGSFRQVIDNTICIANYTNNLVCNIWYSKAALGHRNGLRVRIYGEAGSAEWYQMEPEVIYFNDNKGHKTIIDRGNVDVMVSSENKYNRFKSGHPAGFIEAFANHYHDIADSLLIFKETGKANFSENVFDVYKAIDGLCMLEAIAYSSKNKTWGKV